MKWHFINVVWGEAFVRMFLNASLPTQLCQGNLPYIAGRHECRYKLYTTPADLDFIMQHAAYQRLSEIMEVDAFVVEKIDFASASKHAIMSQCHHHAIQAAWRESAALSFLAPDMLFSKNAYFHTARLAELGKRAVLVPSFRVVQESFLPEFAEKFPIGSCHCIEITSREMVALALRHVHAETLSLYVDSQNFYPGMAGVLFWPVGSEGVLARGFFWHPMMIMPRNETLAKFNTLDTDWINSHLIPNPDDIHLVRDSDEIFYVDMTSVNMVPPKGYGPFSVIDIANKATESVKAEYPRRFLMNLFRIHHQDLSEGPWKQVEQVSESAVHSILSWIQFLESIPSAKRDIQDKIAKELLIAKKLTTSHPPISRIRENQ
jgi:hypothetical protein